MKNQALFVSKDKSKKLKCCLLQFLFGTLRVNYIAVTETTLVPQCFMLRLYVYGLQHILSTE